MKNNEYYRRNDRKLDMWVAIGFFFLAFAGASAFIGLLIEIAKRLPL